MPVARAMTDEEPHAGVECLVDHLVQGTVRCGGLFPEAHRRTDAIRGPRTRTAWRTPGLSEEEIRTRLTGDRLLVRATLDALRAQKRVKVMGSGRAAVFVVPD